MKGGYGFSKSMKEKNTEKRNKKKRKEVKKKIKKFIHLWQFVQIDMFT